MKKIVAALILLVGLVLTPLSATAAVDVFQPCGAGADSEICKGGDNLFGAGSIWNRILNAITFVAGAVAVLMIIIGGLRYTLSNGDQAGINNAKNTILYALVGLILAVMANAIVNFVLTNI
jgi:hypothetical protein